MRTRYRTSMTQQAIIDKEYNGGGKIPDILREAPKVNILIH